MTSGFSSVCSTSRSHRSGVRRGKSEPNRIRFLRNEFAARTSCGGKYFGLQPDKSIHVLCLCVATEIASSCHGTEGCAMMICRSGNSAATVSSSMGFDRASRNPRPPRIPAPIPVWPVWKRATTPASCNAA
ncbi:MAG: hypothetical protein K0Q58_1517 [Microbacterium sp.]|nr:hypothetical protein [Microbacterium sp.]